jgi:hypothetical protein
LQNGHGHDDTQMANPRRLKINKRLTSKKTDRPAKRITKSDNRLSVQGPASMKAATSISHGDNTGSVSGKTFRLLRQEDCSTVV